MTRVEKDKKALLSVLSGQWGTIGPRSLEGAKTLCRLTGASYGVTTFSLTAALEALLRGLGIGYGDRVMVASYSDPADSMTTAAIGATPHFADIDRVTGIISKETAEAKWQDGISAVIVDAPHAKPGTLAELRAFLRERNAHLILNLRGAFALALTHELASSVDAIALDINDSLLCPGVMGGAFLTNDRRIYDSGFAYHNCGRTPGEGSTLDMGDIIGGDLRIAEWQASLLDSAADEAATGLEACKGKARAISEKITLPCLSPASDPELAYALYYTYDKAKNGGVSTDRVISDLREQGIPASREYSAMHRQPFFEGEYYKKLTGANGTISDDGLENSITAEQSLIKINTEA